MGVRPETGKELTHWLAFISVGRECRLAAVLVEADVSFISFCLGI